MQRLVSEEDFSYTDSMSPKKAKKSAAEEYGSKIQRKQSRKVKHSTTARKAVRTGAARAKKKRGY